MLSDISVEHQKKKTNTIVPDQIFRT